MGQQGTLSHVWAPIGVCPARVRDCRHESAYLLGAICPASAVGAAVVMPRVSNEAMALHLAEVSKQVATSAHTLLVCDGTGWHQPGERLTVPENVNPAALAAVCAQAEPNEECVKVPARQPAQHDRVGGLHRHCGRPLRLLERPHDECRAHCLHHRPNLGTGQSFRWWVSDARHLLRFFAQGTIRRHPMRLDEPPHIVQHRRTPREQRGEGGHQPDMADPGI